MIPLSSNPTPTWETFHSTWDTCLAARRDEDQRRGIRGALRLYHGPLEGEPGLFLDRYGRTLVLLSTHRDPLHWEPLLPTITADIQARYPECTALLYKNRHAMRESERFGRRLYGARLETQVREHGVRYAVNLIQSQDCGFFPDTRELRAWMKAESQGLRVLNCFAYTGSLGVAAAVGGAAEVVQLDRNDTFLNLAKQSMTLNGLEVRRHDFVAQDFFKAVARWRLEDRSFDLVVLDPPYVAEGPGGRVDQVANFTRLINKVRPLVADGGRLVVVNNALFLSGQAFDAGLEALMGDGYVQVETRIPVPEDCAGYPATRVRPLPSDPAPYNHATKIAVLRVRRK